ncbi:MAG: hypothetical protein PVG68_05350 [Desulfobacterales bacterium]
MSLTIKNATTDQNRNSITKNTKDTKIKNNITSETPRNSRQLTGFFIPLAIQAASQALSYPLVAMVASRGPGGPLNLAGLAQSTTVMVFLGMFGITFVTTGMVYAASREGYRTFRNVVLLTGLGVIFVQAALSIPGVAHLLFGGLIGLPPSIETPAKITLLTSIPVQFLFFLRTPYLVIMYINKATAKASIATIGRIAFTALLSPIFSNTGLVGPVWAVVCLTLPVALECLVAKLYADPFIKGLNPSMVEIPRASEIFMFNLPLSVGGYLLSASAIIMGAFIARAPDPERVLPVCYLALGLANPLAYAATRIQTTVLAFPPTRLKDPLTFRFAVAAGLCLGMTPLIFILPGLMELYYVTLQKLNPVDLNLVRITAIALIAYPLSVAIRAQSEGLAAWSKKPATVMAGHSIFLLIILTSGFILLFVGAQGYVICAVSLSLGSLSSSATMRILMSRSRSKPAPVAPTTTSVGQIR